jgi:GT2 family glycosyltransferase
MAALRLAVVVPTHRRPERLARLVAALEAQTLSKDRWSAVIVDDASGDATGAVLEQLAASAGFELRGLRTPAQGGPATARNLGWRSVEADCFAFTDDDCVPSPRWLEAGLAAMLADPAIGILQGPTERAPRHPPRPDGCLTVVREVGAPSPWFEGCNLFVRRDALLDSGGFDEGIGWMGEETAMAWSVLDRGWRRGWAPGAVVVHDVEERPLAWHLRNHYLEGHAVRIAARHPAVRAEWWRPWAIEPRGAAFGAAVVGALAATRDRRALVLALPYLADLFPPGAGVPGRAQAAMAGYRVASDVASLAGKLREGIRFRTLVL